SPRTMVASPQARARNHFAHGAALALPNCTAHRRPDVRNEPCPHRTRNEPTHYGTGIAQRAAIAWCLPLSTRPDGRIEHAARLARPGQPHRTGPTKSHRTPRRGKSLRSGRHAPRSPTPSPTPTLAEGESWWRRGESNP